MERNRAVRGIRRFWQGEGREKGQIPGSVAFEPSVAGLMIAGEVGKGLCDHRLKQS